MRDNPTQGPRLGMIKAQKQVSYGLAHSQRDPAPPAVLFTVLKHMTTLAEGLQISQPVIGGIVVKVRGRQHDPCPYRKLNPNVLMM
jgi:hypothetical protein